MFLLSWPQILAYFRVSRVIILSQESHILKISRSTCSKYCVWYDNKGTYMILTDVFWNSSLVLIWRNQVWKWLSSGMSRRVIWYKFTDVPVVLAASIIGTMSTPRPRNWFQIWEQVGRGRTLAGAVVKMVRIGLVRAYDHLVFDAMWSCTCRSTQFHNSEDHNSQLRSQCNVKSHKIE
jgi:hypothetical protein